MTFGPCMCGDTACPSCGPLQGYDPSLERVLDFLGELLIHEETDESDDLPITADEIVSFVAQRLGRNPAIRAIVEVEADRWATESKAKAVAKIKPTKKTRSTP